LAEGKPELRDRVELAIITYNRAEPLERTLQHFLESPFAGCRITILDNCSTDETAEVCRRFAERFDDLHVLRHPYNIGLSANYLRAVELTRAPYSWILSDDESYDFSDCEDLVEVLLEGEVDLISIGSPHQHAWERGLRTTVPELIARGGWFHNSFTFIAGALFRTELFRSDHFFRGYRYTDTLYPHFPFVHDQVARGSSIYIARQPIVGRTVRPINETTGDYMSWMVRWVRACEGISNPVLRKDVIYEGVGDRREWAKQLLIKTMLTRLDDPARLPRYLADLLVICRGEQRAVVAACLPLAVLPRPVYAAVRRLVRTRRGIPMEDPEFDEFRL
jgi:glycosyltransferase involved in cell wall biosynthesis